jgi:hypothetical protein
MGLEAGKRNYVTVHRAFCRHFREITTSIHSIHTIYQFTKPITCCQLNAKSATHIPNIEKTRNTGRQSPHSQ